MRPASILLALILLSTELRAEEYVVRYFDLRESRIVRRFKAGRLPVVLKYYGGAWHSLCYFSGDTSRFFTGTYVDKDGRKPNGHFVYYHRSGTRAAVYQYADGLKTGECRKYDPEGRLAATSEWIAGQQHGPDRHFYPDSTCRAQIHWTAGHVDSSRYFHRNGSLAEYTSRLQNGKQKTVCRDEAGNVGNCALFATKNVLMPPGFEAFCIKHLRFPKSEIGRDLDLLYLQINIDEHGDYAPAVLARRWDGLKGTIGKIMTSLEYAQDLPLNVEFLERPDLLLKIREKLAVLPRAIPAYDHSTIVRGWITIEVEFY